MDDQVITGVEFNCMAVMQSAHHVLYHQISVWWV